MRSRPLAWSVDETRLGFVEVATCGSFWPACSPPPLSPSHYGQHSAVVARASSSLAMPLMRATGTTGFHPLIPRDAQADSGNAASGLQTVAANAIARARLSLS